MAVFDQLSPKMRKKKKNVGGRGGGNTIETPLPKKSIAFKCTELDKSKVNARGIKHE